MCACVCECACTHVCACVHLHVYVCACVHRCVLVPPFSHTRRRAHTLVILNQHMYLKADGALRSIRPNPLLHFGVGKDRQGGSQQIPRLPPRGTACVKVLPRAMPLQEPTQGPAAECGRQSPAQHQPHPESTRCQDKASCDGYKWLPRHAQSKL